MQHSIQQFFLMDRFVTFPKVFDVQWNYQRTLESIKQELANSKER